MSHIQSSQLPDADMQGAPAALQRAAQRAREIARQTGTGVVVMRDGTLTQEGRQDTPRPQQGIDPAVSAWLERWRGCLAGREVPAVDDERLRGLLDKHLR
jgi:hypothetical protein